MRFLFSFVLFAFAASVAHAQNADPQVIIDRAIEAHGSAVLDNAVVEFNFRGRHFTVTRNNGMFRYEREYTEEGRIIRNILNNDGVSKEINGRPVPILAQERASIETAVNSVVYFALLPYFLNDDAVQKEYVGTATINDQPYHKIIVTFQQEGGGRDWEDRFVYWIHREHDTMDYLAYFFHVNGGGTRFREAYNERTVEGVRFADYKNYTAPSIGAQIEAFDDQPPDMQLLTDVALENLTVRRLEQ